MLCFCHLIIFNTLIFKERGHTFRVCGCSYQYYGTVTLVSADNPASSSLGGFKESCSAYKPCRQCTGNNEEIREKVHILMFILVSTSVLTVFVVQ